MPAVNVKTLVHFREHPRLLSALVPCPGWEKFSEKDLRKELKKKRDAWEALTRRNQDISDDFIASASVKEVRKSLAWYESAESSALLVQWLVPLMVRAMKPARAGGAHQDGGMWPFSTAASPALAPAPAPDAATAPPPQAASAEVAPTPAPMAPPMAPPSVTLRDIQTTKAILQSALNALEEEEDMRMDSQSRAEEEEAAAMGGRRMRMRARKA